MFSSIGRGAHWFLAVSLVATIFLLSPPQADATIIHVPTDQPTIQAAINAAVNGDTVQVSPGIYHENINFMGKAITVTSTTGPPAAGAATPPPNSGTPAGTYNLTVTATVTSGTATLTHNTNLTLTVN